MKLLHLLRHVYTDLPGMDLIQVLDITKTLDNLINRSGELEIIYLECPRKLRIEKDPPIPAIVEVADIHASRLEIMKYWNTIAEINNFARYISEKRRINRDLILQFFDTQLILEGLDF